MAQLKLTAELPQPQWSHSLLLQRVRLTGEHGTGLSPRTSNSDRSYKAEQFIQSFGAVCSFLHILDGFYTHQQ